MAFNVRDFYAKLKYGGARQNLFEVVMTFPPALGQSGQNGQFSFMCKAASLPGEEIGVIPVPYFGRSIKVPGDRTFPEWQTTVIIDEDFKLRDAFEIWHNRLNAHEANVRDPALLLAPNYTTTVTVLQYGKTGADNVIKEYDLIGAWPSSVSPQETAWDANDQIQEMQVTWQYQWWEARTTL